MERLTFRAVVRIREDTLRRDLARQETTFQRAVGEQSDPMLAAIGHNVILDAPRQHAIGRLIGCQGNPAAGLIDQLDREIRFLQLGFYRLR